MQADALPLDEYLERRYEHWISIEDAGAEEYVLQMCADSIEYWINNYASTYDPRRSVPVIPFVLFRKQAEFIRWLQDRERNQEDGILEKSRDMGATWLCCAYVLHGWLFRPGFSAGFGSRKLELVDRRGDLDSIFEKIRFLLDRLPRWMWPAGFSIAEHDNLARLVNPANGTSITGEGGDNIGRGGRKSIYFVDEAAFLERPQLVDRALSQNTRVRIEVSTPNGPGNPFAEKRHSGRVPVFTLHWRDDPRKGEEWYAEQKRRFDSVTVAQEIDIDYNASIEGICIPGAWVRAAVDLHIWAQEEHGIEFPETADPIAGFDVAEEGKNKSVFLWRRGVVVQPPVSWGQCNVTETAWRARDLAVKHGVKAVNYDANAVGAGIKGAWKTAEGGMAFQHNGVLSGSSPSDAVWPDGTSSREKFLNLRAEMWWMLRVRFEKAYEFREKGIKHPVEEMISIPNHPQMIAELSQPLKLHTNTGKLKVESKDDMRKRGIASPDHADALCLCFGVRPLRKLCVFV